LYRRPYSQFAKRTFDVTVSLVLGLLVCPVLPVLALLVRRSGPVIFRQVRLGEGGRPFTIYKFRTMRVDAEANGAVWASEHDPRITPVGRFLRKMRLDELPQLWNVLRGEMSIVGPRPERPEFVAQLEAEVPFWGRRHLVKPGVTGWAQVRRGYTADAAGTGDKLSYDLWYLRHRSLVVDLAICVKTFSTLVTASGAR
jgi:exopolysaccharide biosynthesis polyprenyl glycosylphosphotransferase